MLLPAFRVSFPEFAGATDVLVQAKLDAATLEVDAQLFGRFYDSAHGYLTAHHLTQSPYGQNARMVPKAGGIGEQSSTYWAQFVRLRAFATVGFRVC